MLTLIAQRGGAGKTALPMKVSVAAERADPQDCAAWTSGWASWGSRGACLRAPPVGGSPHFRRLWAGTVAD